MKDSDRADLSARACGVVIDSDGFGCCGGVDADGVEDAAAGFEIWLNGLVGTEPDEIYPADCTVHAVIEIGRAHV